MSKATQMVFDLMNQSPDHLFQLLIISDGELHDLERGSGWYRSSNYVLDLVKSTSQEQFGRQSLHVAGIRLGTEGSTRAMTCFFKYHTHPVPTLLKDISHSVEEVHMSMLEVFHHFFCPPT